MAKKGIDELKDWLIRERPGTEELDLDTDLIDTRILDSVTFINFVYFVEEFTGKKIPLTSQETVDSFRTLRSIQDHILEDGHDARERERVRLQRG